MIVIMVDNWYYTKDVIDLCYTHTYTHTNRAHNLCLGEIKRDAKREVDMYTMADTAADTFNDCGGFQFSAYTQIQLETTTQTT